MGAKILVVDDDAIVTAYMVDTLARLGHTACEANSGSQAIAMLRADNTFALVLTDLHMGLMDGYEFTDLVRLMRPGLPILLVTADEHAGEDRQCRMPVLLKPYTRHQLAKAVSDARTAPVH